MMNERNLRELISQYRSLTNVSRSNGKYLSVENIIECLDLLHKIIEFLGVFKEIMFEIKNDLIEAIFSHKLTANNGDNISLIKRIPYFILYNHSLETEKVKTLEFQNITESIRQQLFQEIENVKMLNEINNTKEMVISSLESELMKCRMEISELHSKIKYLSDSNLENEENSQKLIKEINKENIMLKDELAQQHTVISNLQYYKEAHEHLDQSFMNACQNYDDNEEKQCGDPFNKKANLEMEIKTIETMNNDLIVLENLMLNDFDKRSSEFKQQIMNYKYIENNSSNSSYHENQDSDKLIAKAIMDFNKAKLHFQNEFAQIQIESLMLQNHRTVLINDWSIIHESEMEKETNLSKEHKNIKASFIIDNKIISKYSAIIYISNDGQSFYECKEVRYCESCGNKSVICPHNLNEKSLIIKLPVGSSFIKIQRPEMRINSKYAKYFTTKSHDLSEERSEKVLNEERKQSSRKSLRSTLLSSQSTKDSEIMISFESLLEDFKNRTKIQRISPRRFNEAQMLSILEDFWATILNEDDYDPQQSEITTFLDKLYLFFLDRYSHEKAAMLSLFDFFTSIIESSAFHQIILLFCHVLIANIDSSVMRYLFHLVDCIEIIHWKNEDDFRFFISVIHPFLSEDDIDSVVLSYISFAENIFEPGKIFEFLLYNFLKRRDPRFSWVISEAAELKTTVPGFYTFKEFQVLLEFVTSLPNKKLSIRLFKEMALFYTEEGCEETVPISKVSEMIGFLSLLESVEIIKQKLSEKYASHFEDQKPRLKWSYSRLIVLASKLLREN